MGMSETRPKRKVEFIESYLTGGELGSNYEWNDNHGELIRCKDCKHGEPCNEGDVYCNNDIGTFESPVHKPDWFCADGERRDNETPTAGDNKIPLKW